MNVYQCEEIMCGHCVSRITKALTEAKIEHQVNLEHKTVTIEDSENCATKAEEILEDLGFSPVKTA